ncbi:MAG: hypothetical protein EHM59_05725 [Betaproteobacteria bacterium]|nr:MAG: hypothetical protein EHM59_05725 [Betaproteobacteria bacterium]
MKDLAPVTQFTATPNALVVHPSIPATSVQELIALAKRRPGSLISAWAGPGTSNHMAFVLFAMLTQTGRQFAPGLRSGPARGDDQVGEGRAGRGHRGSVSERKRRGQTPAPGLSPNSPFQCVSACLISANVFMISVGLIDSASTPSWRAI